MNAVDIAVGLLCLAFAAAGVVRGFVHQLFGLGGILIGHALGVRYNAEAARFLGLSFPHADVAAYLVVLVVAYALARLAGALVAHWVKESSLSGTDRALGLLAGLLKGGFLSVLLVTLLVVILPPGTPTLKSSRVVPHALVPARWVAPWFPDGIARPFSENARALEGGKAGGSKAPGKAAPGAAPAPAPVQPKNRSRK